MNGAALDLAFTEPERPSEVPHSAEWDFEGQGIYPARAELAPAARLTVAATHAYLRPGTYYPVLRAAVQRNGDAGSPYARVENIGRARVVVV